LNKPIPGTKRISRTLAFFGPPVFSGIFQKIGHEPQQIRLQGVITHAKLDMTKWVPDCNGVGDTWGLKRKLGYRGKPGHVGVNLPLGYTMGPGLV